MQVQDTALLYITGGDNDDDDGTVDLVSEEVTLIITNITSLLSLL